jgi:hypothetical protein
MARYCQGLNDYDEGENHWKHDKKKEMKLHFHTYKNFKSLKT